MDSRWLGARYPDAEQHGAATDLLSTLRSRGAVVEQAEFHKSVFKNREIARFQALGNGQTHAQRLHREESEGRRAMRFHGFRSFLNTL
ncbi:MAG TPA: hypothetical protein VE913_03010 [Longimicrobium sp.]|nr:hypothetical protein [Longimicrobium sp.]